MKTKPVLLAILLGCSLVASAVRAETQSVIDPNEQSEAAKPAPAATKPAQSDATLRRERQRAAQEQRKRAQAEARAQAAEKESARLRALEQARQAEAAAREAAAARAAARKVAAARAAAVRAAAANATRARIAADKEAFARENAAREAAARELAARETVAREAAAREAAAKEMAAKETAARDARVKFATARETPFREVRPSRAPRFGTVFRDCADCPELVWLPQGDFVMGEASPGGEARPVVTINYLLAVGRFEVTFAEWDACAADGGCRRRPDDSGWGRGWQPVVNVSWTDAKQYIAWLSRRTGKRYRLLSDAEWEYAARAGTDARYWWGNHAGRGDANCADCGSKWDGRQAAPVGRFAPNPFGLYDMHGNVSEWVEDCYHDGFRQVSGDGRARMRECSAQTDARVVRGGAWHGSTKSMRSTSRTSAVTDYYDNRIGFRIARTE